jgi:dihydrofolate reductase
MTQVIFDISMSLDGFVDGPNPSREHPLGEGGEQLHEWAIPTKTFRERHGRAGGEAGPDDDVLREAFERTGATVMGRRMFSGGEGPWGDDPNADGWWGDNPPFGGPVFVLTNHPREPLVKGGGTTFAFVTDGIESAIAQAREAADAKDVSIGGGASVIQQALAAGLVDEFQLHVAPVILGAGVRLFGDSAARPLIEPTRVVNSARAVHLAFRLGTRGAS